MKYQALYSILLFVSLTACDPDIDKSVPCVEAVPATVRDLQGLDGCGFVFELNDGTRLEPLRLAFCGTPPLPKEITENPLYNFEFVDGKHVVIGYETQTDYGSYCMVGPVVKITCITEAEPPSDGNN
jgi:hypothetical protein